MDRHPHPGFDFNASDLVKKRDSGERIDIAVTHERETHNGWVYYVTLTSAGGRHTTHDISLAWCDHDYWTGGKVPPSRTLEMVLAMAVRLAGAQVVQDQRPKYDAARLRRVCPMLDDAMGVHGGD